MTVEAFADEGPNPEMLPVPDCTVGSYRVTDKNESELGDPDPNPRAS
jgi:hypothetical protein